MKLVNKFIILVFSALLIQSVLMAGDFDKTADPQKDVSEALQKAKKSNKHIVLIVGGDWCRWTGTFENFLDDNEKIAKSFYDSFEVVEIYYGKGMNKSAKALLKQFPPITGTPYFYILDKTAKLLYAINSESMERGYGYNRNKVIKFIKTYK